MDDMYIEKTFIHTNDIKLHTIIAGQPAGIPIILLHGFPENWRCWIKQLPALVKAGYRVIIPDQRGYNLSDKPKGMKNYGIYTLVDDIIGIMNTLDYEKVNLVGHDWGAFVAWVLAHKYPERLLTLSILNVPHPLVMKKFLLSDLEQLFRSWYVFFFQIPWLPEKVMATDNWRIAVRALKVSGGIDTFTDEDVEKYKEAWSQPGAITSMINWYRAGVRYMRKLPKDLSIKNPTLIIWGMKDIFLSHRMASPSMDYVEEGNLIFIPEATHWVQHDAAEKVNHHLIDFLFTYKSQT